LLDKAAMKISFLLIWFFLVTLAELGNGAVFPPVLKKTSEFYLQNNEEPSSRKLEEYLSFGEQFPAFLYVTGEQLPFVMDKPVVDTCGTIHFKGRAVRMEEKKDDLGPEYRFIEAKNQIDISCNRVPFPRCGTFRSIETDKAGEYLLEEIKFYRSECDVHMLSDSGIDKVFRVRLPVALPGN